MFPPCLGSWGPSDVEMGSAETQASGEPGITFQLDKSWNAEHPRAHPQTAKTAWRQSHAHPVLGRRETNQNNAFTKMTDGQGGRPVSTCHEAVSARVNPEFFYPPEGAYVLSVIAWGFGRRRPCPDLQ